MMMVQNRGQSQQGNADDERWDVREDPARAWFQLMQAEQDYLKKKIEELAAETWMTAEAVGAWICNRSSRSENKLSDAMKSR